MRAGGNAANEDTSDEVEKGTSVGAVTGADDGTWFGGGSILSLPSRALSLIRTRFCFRSRNGGGGAGVDDGAGTGTGTGAGVGTGTGAG